MLVLCTISPSARRIPRSRRRIPRSSRRPYVAHGFQTLANKTEVICQVSGRCKPAWVIYRIAGTNPVSVVGAEPRR
jgi:hypothetical protein